MSKQEDQALERELGKICQRRDLFLFGLGGLLASKLTSKISPTEKHELTITVLLDITEARAKTCRILKGMGKLVTPSNAVESGLLWAHIGAGYIDVNPTIVRVEFIGASNKVCQVVIAGASKEALLVKQRSAYKAVEQIKAQLLGEKLPDFS